MIDVVSTLEDNIITYYITRNEDIKLREWYITVNNVVKKHMNNLTEEENFEIIYDQDYINGDNNITLNIKYYNADGVCDIYNYNIVHNCSLCMPSLSITNYSKIQDELCITYNVKQTSEMTEGSEDGTSDTNIVCYINNIPCITTNNCVNIPMSLINSSVNDLTFIIDANGIKYKCLYKLISKKDILISNKYFYTKPIKYKRIANKCRVSYIHNQGVFCFYTIDCNLFYNVVNGKPFVLNNDTVRLLFVFDDNAKLNSYKVEFSNYII